MSDLDRKYCPTCGSQERRPKPNFCSNPWHHPRGGIVTTGMTGPVSELRRQRQRLQEARHASKLNRRRTYAKGKS